MTEQMAPDQVADNWSGIADSYQSIFESLTAQFADRVLAELQPGPGESLIDVAAGTGYFSMAAAGRGADILATDFAPGMVSRIRQRIDESKMQNIDVRVMDGQALDVPDESFDISTSIVGLIFFPDIAKGFSELRRVLRPGGRCGVVCWDMPEYFDMMKLLRRSVEEAVPDFSFPSQTPVWARLVGVDGLTRQFEQAGFDDIDVQLAEGRLEIESPELFWNSFIAASPPMIALFNALGEEKTVRAGEAFARIAASEFSKGGRITLCSRACIGYGRVMAREK